MEFGLIKTKIEKRLHESYLDDSIKNDLFIFNELVLKNKDISRLFSLYSDLAENRGYDNSFATEFIKESITEIKKLKPSKNSISEINMWLSTTKVDNEYVDIDNLVSEKTISVEDKIKSKNNILESLMLKEPVLESLNGVSVGDLVNVANKTIKNHLDTLSESDRKELKKIISESDSKLKVKYDVIKENTVERLESLKENSESDVLDRINETLNKLSLEEYSKLNYFKLKELNKNL
jgi:hypothetical protein